VSILIVIPARLGATRLPQKPLRLLGGQPLIVRVWERVVSMRLADRVVVATDSHAVAAAAKAAGADVAMTRPDHVSGTDRVAEVAARQEFSAFDVLVNVQGDEPFISADAIRGATAFVDRGTFPLGTAACRATTDVLLNAAVVKVVTDDRDRALYFSRAPIPFLKNPIDRAQRDALVRQHLGIYAYTREALSRWVALPPHPLEIVEGLEQLRAIADGLAMGVATVAPLPGDGIDTEDDLANANARWSERKPTAAGSH
jgi:3-deoxy-manno-octulosonate cytidylyltransferase (CMP-KDO synthetase)